MVRRTSIPTSPDNPLLDYQGVADLLTELGRPAQVGTVRTYYRNGLLPLPDMQTGGKEYPPDAEVKSYHKRTRPPHERDPRRPWTEREREGSNKGWLRSTIISWNETRTGPGRWKKTPDRSKEIQRRTISGRLPPPAAAKQAGRPCPRSREPERAGPGLLITHHQANEGQNRYEVQS